MEVEGSYKAYTKRWFILGLFVMYSSSNAFHWIQYSIINNIISRYYGVEAWMVDWCSMIYMVVYIPLIFPASWYLQKQVRDPHVLLKFTSMCFESCFFLGIAPK